MPAASRGMEFSSIKPALLLWTRECFVAVFATRSNYEPSSPLPITFTWNKGATLAAPTPLRHSPGLPHPLWRSKFSKKDYQVRNQHLIHSHNGRPPNVSSHELPVPRRPKDGPIDIVGPMTGMHSYVTCLC
jgi:hypothetical protein